MAQPANLLADGNKPRVLIVENDLEVRESNIAKLKYWGYDPIVATGKGRALLADAKAKASAQNCQLALTDMHLLDDHDREDWSGLHLVPELLPARTIIYSGSINFQAVRGALNEYQALDFVGKAEGPEYLRSVLDKYAAQLCACRRGLSILWPEDWSSARVAEVFTRENPVSPDEADDVLARLFPQASKLELQFLSGFHPSSITLPRPRSLVMLAREDDGQPVIVKLAWKQKIEKEVENYEQHIRRNLVGSYRPMLQAHHSQWQIGGVVYSFVGISEKIIPLARFYQAAKPRQIRSVLRQFFTVTWSPLYARVSTVQDSSLFDAYCRVWYGDWWVERLREHVQNGRVPAVCDTWTEAAGLGLPEPVQWLDKRVRQGRAGDMDLLALAVTHGDMHAENLLVDTANLNAWVIDFERTGLGPVLQDFTELESDLINHLAGFHQADPRRLYELAVCAAQPEHLGKVPGAAGADALIAKVLDTIDCLRRIAAEQTGVSDAQEYLWGLLFNTLFRALILINYQEIGPKLDRALLLAAILCHRLEHWGEPWPPAAWPRDGR